MLSGTVVRSVLLNELYCTPLNCLWFVHFCTFSPLASSISELYSDMWASDGDARRVGSAKNVLQALVRGNQWFSGDCQHDAHEALRSVLDLLHEELRRPVRKRCYRRLLVGRSRDCQFIVWYSNARFSG